MIDPAKITIGTSGYSFKDWVGPFYPPGTTGAQMLEFYARQFRALELNFTFYSMPVARTLENMARTAGEGFTFWVKANQAITHHANLSVVDEFVENIMPLQMAGRLAGVLLQFPQSFHRTAETRQFLASAVDAMHKVPLAVEFRHRTWDHPATCAGLAERDVTLVVPDVPPIESLYRPPPIVTNGVGYLRLHTRNAANWYAGEARRYDYSYSRNELRELIEQWSVPAQQAKRLYAFFNNCHSGQAGRNALEFRELVQQMAVGP